MNLKIGTSRATLVVPELGIVLKFPKIKIASALKQIRTEVRRGTFLDWLIEEVGYPVELRWSVKGMLLGGLFANLRERRFWKRTRHPLLQPTYFSLFGVLNIQECGDPCEPDLEVWSQLFDITEGEVRRDNHHFESSANFCYRDDWLAITDYGTSIVQQIVSKYGMEILAKFDRSRRTKKPAG